MLEYRLLMIVVRIGGCMHSFPSYHITAFPLQIVHWKLFWLSLVSGALSLSLRLGSQNQNLCLFICIILTVQLWDGSQTKFMYADIDSVWWCALMFDCSVVWKWSLLSPCLSFCLFQYLSKSLSLVSIYDCHHLQLCSPAISGQKRNPLSLTCSSSQSTHAILVFHSSSGRLQLPNLDSLHNRDFFFCHNFFVCVNNKTERWRWK